MSLIAKDLPALIFMLLPGFIAAGVFYTLTAHPKASEFERLVQSLIFTSITKAVVFCVKLLFLLAASRFGWRILGRWDSDVEFAWSVVIAIVVGLIFAIVTNTDLFHRVMRWLNLTTRTSYPSEWYSGFSQRRRSVILHLDGERRLRGLPDQWPDQSDRGHFLIKDPEWILSDNQAAPLYEVERLMLPAVEVKMVEFLKQAEEITQTQEELERVKKLLLDAQQISQEKNHGSESPSVPPQ